MLIIDKTNCTKNLPYTYLLKFNIDGIKRFYYGVRYGNVVKNIIPLNDIFVKYFSSSKYVKSLLNDGYLPYEVIIHKVFESKESACDFEVKFLKKLKVKSNKLFLNQTETFNNKFPNNLGRKMDSKTKLKISKAVSTRQNKEEWKKNKSKQMKAKWSDPEFIKKMKKINEDYKNSEEGKLHFKNRNQSFSNKKHSEKTKEQMSISAKKAALKRNFSESALKRKKYKCPFCNKIIVSSNFKRHLMKTHKLSLNEFNEIPKIES